MSSMQVSSGRPHMLTSNQRGRGNEPVTVLGRIRLAVAVNMGSSDRHCTSTHVRSGINAAAGGQPTVSPNAFYRALGFDIYPVTPTRRAQSPGSRKPEETA